MRDRGLWRLLLIVLASWGLEAAHYAVLLTRTGSGAPGVGAPGMYLRVVAGGAYLAVLRFLGYAGLLWLFTWLYGRRLPGRDALWAASWTAPATAAALTAMTPLLGSMSLLRYLTLCYVLALAAQAAAAAAGVANLYQRQGAPGLVDTLRAVASGLSSAVIMGATPAAMLSPQFHVYAIVAAAAGLSPAG